MRAPAAKVLSIALLAATLALTARSPDGRVTVFVGNDLAILEGGHRYSVALAASGPSKPRRVTFVHIPQRKFPAIVLWQQEDTHNMLDAMAFLAYDPRQGRYEQLLPLAFPTDAASVWTSQGRIRFTAATRLASNTADYGSYVEQTEYAATAGDGSLQIVATVRATRRTEDEPVAPHGFEERPDINGCNELLTAGALRAIAGCIAAPAKGALHTQAGGANVTSWFVHDSTLDGLESILTFGGTTTTLVFPSLSFEGTDAKPAAYAPGTMPPLVVYPFVQCGRDCNSIPEFLAFDARAHRFQPASLWSAEWSGETPQPAPAHRRIDIVAATPILHSEYRSAIPIRAKTNTRYFYVRSGAGETAVLAITVNDGEVFPSPTGCWDASRDPDRGFNTLSPCAGWPAIRGTPVPT